MQTSQKNVILKDLFWLCVILIPLYLLLLGNRPFATPDEARYVEIPREIVASGDWITPRLNGVKYFEKPPLLYWIQALLQKYVSNSEFIMRLPLVCFGLLGILGTYLFAFKAYNRRIALISAFILSTSGLYFALSRLIILDMPVSALITLSLFSFYTATKTPLGLKRRLYYSLFTLFCALGVLTKGLMVLVVLGAVIIIWATLTQNWKQIFPAYMPTHLLLFLLITAPWHILASLHNPEFFHKYFIVEHFLRYTTTLHMRYQPVWFFIPIILVGFFPWSGFIVQACKKAWNNRSKGADGFLLIWAMFIFMFFSFSKSKLIPYILPLFPPLSVLVAKIIEENLQSIKTSRYALLPVFVLSLSAAIISVVALQILPDLTHEKPILRPYVGFLTACFIFISLFCLPFSSNKIQSWKAKYIYSLFKNEFGFRLIGLGIGCLGIIITLIMASPYIQKPSLKDISHTILSLQKEGQSVVSYRAYFQDLPFYTHQKVVVVDAKGELEFGTLVEDTSQWMITEDEFKKRWMTQQMLIVAREGEIERFKKENPSYNFHIIKEDNGIWLIENILESHSK